MVSLLTLRNCFLIQSQMSLEPPSNRDPNPTSPDMIQEAIASVVEAVQPRSIHRRDRGERVLCPSCGRPSARGARGIVTTPPDNQTQAAFRTPPKSHSAAMAWHEGQARMRRSAILVLRRFWIRSVHHCLWRQALSSWRSNLARDLRKVAQEEETRADNHAARVEASRHAVEKCCRQIAASARLVQALSSQSTSRQVTCLSVWRSKAWNYMYETNAELLEGIELESSRRLEKEKEADHLREDLSLTLPLPYLLP